ncbi:ABC transporter ATP-binding protein [Ornithinibacillus gellani]|uniref:ABC transporter ATP-binding protein n=1 Tax=Ornithinibacillus gellani TaxID=2293253 RepID=UPI000F47FBAB|nr:ABC transporter ATP-binding protein [Ornithinibacillus gellani]TQS76223.1 ABC transporter ATP-binding protein [Ornithinibacillus gellani]
MLTVDHISKTYGKHLILNDITFQASPGEIIGLVGENGAGKSTLLRILATINKPTKGSFTLNHLSPTTQKKQIRQHIGFVPQDIAIWDHFTVEENMVFFEKLTWGKKKNKSALQAICKDMELDKWKEKVSTLSGGMKRKLNLAISLIHDPTLILLDEPTVGIDLRSRTEIGNYLRKLATENDKIIIYTSHDMDEIRHICDRIICIGEDPFYYNLLKQTDKEIIAF